MTAENDAMAKIATRAGFHLEGPGEDHLMTGVAKLPARQMCTERGSQ
jgi:hypothetical protein